MKNLTKNILLVSVLLLTFISCKRDEEPEFSADDKNNVTLKFENVLANQGTIALNSTTVTSSSNQKHQFETLKYIVSNVILVKTDGTEYAYELNNPDQGAYIVNQAEQGAWHNFVLKNIPAGNYKSVKFGLGISPEAYVLGKDGQATFWDDAKNNGMGWSWAAGYKFVNFEGVYGNNLDGHFKVHIGNIGNPTVSETPNVYKEVRLELPQTAKVRTDISPQIHIMADIAQFLSGTNDIVLNTSNETAMHPNKPVVQQAAENLSQMFSVHHVHND